MESPDQAVAKLSNVGFTAMLVAFERGIESARDDALFHDPWGAELDRRAGGAGAVLNKKLAEMEFDDVNEGGSWPQFHEQWTAVRTRFVDDQIEAEAALGGRQLVNLGVGLDMRAYRLQGMRQLRMAVEVEAQEMQEARKVLIGPLRLDPMCKRVDVACDVTDTALLSKLLDAGWTHEEPTIWVMEGLLMYLAPADQRTLLCLTGKASAPGSVLIVNCMLATGNPAEPAEMLDEAGVRGVLSEAGWSQAELFRFGDPKLNYGRFKAPKPARNFTFFVARKL